MPFNPTGRQSLPFTLFGGLNSELAPPTIPEGLSPDCQDVSFVPGITGTRPGLKRTLAVDALTAGSGVTYEATYLLPSNDPLNLYYTSDGSFWIQDVTNSPSTVTELFTASPNLYAQSVTAFSREYIAFSDGQKGKDIPRRISSDKSWQRWTQDGPAQPPKAEDALAPEVNIVSIVPNLPPVDIETAVNIDGVVTITTATPSGLQVGDQALITGNSVFSYNGPITVETVPSPNTITYDTVASGWNEGTGGTLVPSSVTVVLEDCVNMLPGDTVVIEGACNTNYDNNVGGVTEMVVSLASLIEVKTYGLFDSHIGAFQYKNASDPATGTNLPSPVTTTTLRPNIGLYMDPPSGVLPNAPGEGGTTFMGVNALGNYDGSSQNVGGPTQYNAFTSVFSLSFSAAGTYSFQTYTNDGFIFGMGGGATAVSGPMVNPVVVYQGKTFGGTTLTAEKGYPILCANNTNIGSQHSGNNGQQLFSVLIPAPGVYPCEINFGHKDGGQWNTLQQATPTADPWLVTHNYVTGDKCSVGGENYVATTNSIGQTPPNTAYWQVITAFTAILPMSVAGGAIYATPPFWNIGTVIDCYTFTFQAVYASGTSGACGYAQIGGLVSPGIHQVCVSWLLDDNTITKPSPPASWSASGYKRVLLTDIPIGPPNVKGRVFEFTGSAGSNFFYLMLPATAPAPPPGKGVQAVSTATAIMDNTTTSIELDFSDLSLYAGSAADITGNDLFGQVTLGPIANVVSYSNRMGAIGNVNKIENMLGMGFEGGNLVAGSPPTMGAPLGWDVSQNTGGVQVSAPNGFGYAWRETGTGVMQNVGLISQSFYEDATDFAPIGLGNTQYSVLVWMQAGQAGTVGTVYFDIYTPESGSLIYASIPAVQVSTDGAWYTLEFNARTPAAIPIDATFRSYSYNLGAGQTIIKDEIFIVYTDEPVNQQTAILFSYAFNGGALHGVTGQLQTEYTEPTYSAKILRDNLYIGQSQHLVRTKDSEIGEPTTWDVPTVSDKTGCLSVRGFDTGEGWVIYGSEAGLYMAHGGEPIKVSQEVQTIWGAIDPTLYRHVQIVNDLENRRIYCLAPITAYAPTGATFSPASCNKILVVDYRELNTAQAIQNAPPLHISMTGRMLSSDLTRKWTVWNIPANSCSVMGVPDVNAQVVFGSGNGNGLSGGYGQVYTIDPAKLSDDDYGIIGSLNGESQLSFKDWLVSGTVGTNGIGTRPTGVWRPNSAYYVTYFSPSHEQEKELQIGSARKIYEYLECYIEGVGKMYMLPLINNVSNPTVRPAAARTMSEVQGWDLEWNLNIKAQRMGMLFYCVPLGTVI